MGLRGTGALLRLPGEQLKFPTGFNFPASKVERTIANQKKVGRGVKSREKCNIGNNGNGSCFWTVSSSPLCRPGFVPPRRWIPANTQPGVLRQIRASAPSFRFLQQTRCSSILQSEPIRDFQNRRASQLAHIFFFSFLLFLFLRIMTHAQCFQLKAPHSLCLLSSSTQRFPPQNPCPRRSRTHPGAGWKGGPHCPVPREPPPCRQVPALGRRCWDGGDAGRSCGEPGWDLSWDPAWRRSRGNAQHPCAWGVLGFFFFWSKAGASQELKGPSDLFVARSLKRSSDVFAYLKIKERREDKREEFVHGKH